MRPSRVPKVDRDPLIKDAAKLVPTASRRVFLRNVNELRGRKSYINRKTYINEVHNGTSGWIGTIRATGRS